MSLPCADLARARGDSLLGTAPQTRAWVLIEHPGPWRRNAFAGSGIAAGVQKQINEAVGRVGGRVLLVRRPGRRYRGAEPLRWAVLGPGRPARWGSWTDDDDLLVAADVLDSPGLARPRAHEPADPPGATETPGTRETPGTPGDDAPQFLVCTHGIHDQCCAVRGRPVAQQLASVWPEHTWECSHLGGDRFAANLLIAPDGVYYGDVDSTDPVALVERHLHGQVTPDHLRGLTSVPPPAQVAIAEIHRRFGPGGVDAVRLDHLEHSTRHQWRVEVTSALPGPGALTVIVERRLSPPARRTCQAPSDDVAVEWDVLSVSPG